MNTHRVIGLSVREAAWLLTMSEQQIRYRLRTGLLEYAVRPTLVSVESIRALFADGRLREVRECVLTRLLLGEVEAPQLATRYARHSSDSLIAGTLIASLPEAWHGKLRKSRSIIAKRAFTSPLNEPLVK